MPATARHAKPRRPATRRRAPAAAAVTLAGVAAVFVLLHGGFAAHNSQGAVAETNAAAGLAVGRLTVAHRHDVAAAEAHMAKRDGARKVHAQRRAAQQQAQQAAAPPSPPP